MFKNYLKIAWRNLTKNKLQTGINLLGLTVGMVSCLSILVYVVAQLGYETGFRDVESLYRIHSKIKTISNTSIDANVATASPPIAFAMKENFPEVSEACRVVYFGDDNGQLVRVLDQTHGYYESRGYVADSTFFELFNYPLVEGNSANTLTQPNSVVLSTALAQKLFGKEKALHRTLILGAGEDALRVTVTGVFNENFTKTHLNPNYILSMSSPGIGAFVRSIDNFATQNFAYTYIKINKRGSVADLEKKLPDFLTIRGAEDLAQVGFKKTLHLQPVKDINLYSQGIAMQIDKVSNIQHLYIMLLLGFVILLVACVNFINLSTARASKRAKEIGVRKVVGADKNSLVFQFLSESIVVSLFAAIISIPLALVLLPFINEITDGNLSHVDVLNYKILMLLFSLSLITGILAGIYPALIMSSFKPVKVLKGVFHVQSGNGAFRKALVVFQFVVSITLVIAVIIITQQLQFVQKKDLGFEKENQIVIRLGTEEVQKKAGALKEEIAAVSGVSEVAMSSNYPSGRVRGDRAMYLPGQDPANPLLVYANYVSANYFNTVGTEILAGRDLRPTDSTQVIVNKATLDAFNIPLEKALASTLIWTWEGSHDEVEIVGVIENYQFGSIKEAISPMIIFYEDTSDWLIVKTETEDSKALLQNLEKSWKAINPYTPFTFSFVNDEIQKMFEEERRLEKISIVFTLLAILICCLGLFGLVSYVAEQKKKEIGVRKVLGASIHSVVQLLTKDFIKLVIIAFMIASPIAYFFMQRWLEDFTYRIELQWWVFLLAGVLAILITLLTVGFQSVKAAMANPVKSLRTE